MHTQCSVVVAVVSHNYLWLHVHWLHHWLLYVHRLLLHVHGLWLHGYHGRCDCGELHNLHRSTAAAAEDAKHNETQQNRTSDAHRNGHSKNGAVACGQEAGTVLCSKSCSIIRLLSRVYLQGMLDEL